MFESARVKVSSVFVSMMFYCTQDTLKWYDRLIFIRGRYDILKCSEACKQHPVTT